jgi:hypothetical protein
MRQFRREENSLIYGPNVRKTKDMKPIKMHPKMMRKFRRSD